VDQAEQSKRQAALIQQQAPEIEVLDRIATADGSLSSSRAPGDALQTAARVSERRATISSSASRSGSAQAR
jgi:hypothetical protein